MKTIIDLNADLGESGIVADIARDIAMMDIVSSANIACGGHAGDAEIMREMLTAASARGVRAGAHPSYPDRANFGRISMQIDAEALLDALVTQISALADLARQLDIPIAHVKPHGALYNDAADDADLADLVADAAALAAPGAALVGLAGGAMDEAAKKRGLRFIAEGFVDRRYAPQGRLQPRSEDGAVIAGEAERAAQALAIARGDAILASHGGNIVVQADSLCLHSDSDGALQSAAAVRAALCDAGISIGAAM